jgi:hypothetical protein
MHAGCSEFGEAVSNQTVVMGPCGMLLGISVAGLLLGCGRCYTLAKHNTHSITMCCCLQDGCAAAAAFVEHFSAQAALKGQLLQHLPSLLQALANPARSPTTAATAAVVLCRLTQDTAVSGSGGEHPPLYAGSAGQTALAAYELTPLVQGMISNAGKLSSDCAAALHNVAQTTAGKQALCKHMAGLVEALQPAHDWGVAQLASDMICSVLFSGDIGWAAANPYWQYVPHHHHHQITKLSHSINAIGPAPHRSGSMCRM